MITPFATPVAKSLYMVGRVDVTGIDPNNDTHGKLGPAAITLTPYNSLAFCHCFTVPSP